MLDDMEKTDRAAGRVYVAPSAAGTEVAFPLAFLQSGGQNMEDPIDNGELDW